MNVFLEHGAPEEVAVRVFCLVFNRIVDLEDIGRHMNTLSESIRFELQHRIGVLNLWTSTYPGMQYYIYCLDDKVAMFTVLIIIIIIICNNDFFACCICLK